MYAVLEFQHMLDNRQCEISLCCDTTEAAPTSSENCDLLILFKVFLKSCMNPAMWFRISVILQFENTISADAMNKNYLQVPLRICIIFVLTTIQYISNTI